jgi:hypothetical protein
MKAIKLPAKIKGKKLIPANTRNYENALSLYEGLEVVITIAKPTKSRTNPQNAYLWAVPYRMISDETGNDIDSVHHYMAGMFLSEKTSGLIDQVKSTTRLTTVEFSEYIEKIIQWAAEFLNLYIELPNEKEMWGGL